MNTAPYWDKQPLILYGLLGGYTRLSSEEISQAAVDFANIEGNVLLSIKLLAGLEESQKIQVHHIWLDLKKYKRKLKTLPESADRDELIDKVQDIIDWEVDGHNTLRANILDLLEWETILTEQLAGCLDFTIKVKASKWIRGVVQEYLERYRQGELFTPIISTYLPYRQQRLALADYLERSNPQHTLDDRLLPEKIRLLELVFDLVDNSKLALEGFDKNFNPIVNTDINKGINAQQVDLSKIKLEPNSYDAANGVLTILGEKIIIIKQPKMKGKLNEKNPARLLRALFNPTTFPDPVPIKSVFGKDSYYIQNNKYSKPVVNKASTLTAEINERIQETLVGIKLVKCDGLKFEIDERYLKK